MPSHDDGSPLGPDADAHPDLVFRGLIDEALRSFVEQRRPLFAELGPDLVAFADAALDFVDGGKRLRPQFCRAGWLVAGGTDLDPDLVEVAASLEWLQGSALVHDDLMDGSDTRRGRPSVHRAFEADHRSHQRQGDAAWFGRSTAVLMGDLMLSWCTEMLTAGVAGADPAAARRAVEHLDLCKSEVVAGQFLDVIGQTREALDVDEAMTVAVFKSAKYTVERPLHIGASLAGADDAMLAALTAVARPLGTAFQLRDDVLGVFGDPVVTGKPAGDDLREGKRTVLIARAHELTDGAGRTLLADGLGTDDGVGPVRDLIVASGALAAVESDIARLEHEADDAIDALGAGDVLGPLALRATRRDR